MNVLKTYGEDTASFKPSKTYSLKGNRIEGSIDGIEAMLQAVDLTLSTERFAHSIYSADYGIELADLIGKPRTLVMGDIERRITESLMQDDRVQGIQNFRLCFNKENVIVSFTVISIFGDIERRADLGRI